jgi:hypothetical protein
VGPLELGDMGPCKHCRDETTDQNPNVNVHRHDGDKAWDGCLQCLISLIDGQQKYRDGDVDCLCGPYISLGCKCGAMVRERFLKKKVEKHVKA